MQYQNRRRASHDTRATIQRSSGDEESEFAKKTTRAVREHQITHVTKPGANTGLDLVTL